MALRIAARHSLARVLKLNSSSNHSSRDYAVWLRWIGKYCGVVTHEGVGHSRKFITCIRLRRAAVGSICSLGRSLGIV